MIAYSYMNGDGFEIIATETEAYGLALDYLGKYKCIQHLTTDLCTAMFIEAINCIVQFLFFNHSVFTIVLFFAV